MTSPTAGLLLIGDEILSGRTKDKNLGYIADFLTALGIELREPAAVDDADRRLRPVPAPRGVGGLYLRLGEDDRRQPEQHLARRQPVFIDADQRWLEQQPEPEEDVGEMRPAKSSVLIS